MNSWYTGDETYHVFVANFYEKNGRKVVLVSRTRYSYIYNYAISNKNLLGHWLDMVYLPQEGIC